MSRRRRGEPAFDSVPREAFEALSAELAALQQEVIDVCAAPKLATCPDCNGARRVEGVHHTPDGPRCYYVACAVCEGRGLVIA